MAQPFGLSFQPGADQQGGTGSGQPGEPNVSPLQSAVKLLSLRLPTVLGAQAPAPSQLLQPHGDDGHASALALLRKLIGGGSGQQGQESIASIMAALAPSQSAQSMDFLPLLHLAQNPPKFPGGTAGPGPGPAPAAFAPPSPPDKAVQEFRTYEAPL